MSYPFSLFVLAILAAICTSMGLLTDDIGYGWLALLLPCAALGASRSPRALRAGLGLLMLGAVVAWQPPSLSVAVCTLFPLLTLAFHPRGNPILRQLLGLVAASMYGTLLYLQLDGQLAGVPAATLLQLGGVALLWYSLRQTPLAMSWHPLLGLLLLAFCLWHEALIALACGLMMLLFSLYALSVRASRWLPPLTLLLPALAFATQVLLVPELPSPVLIAWLMLFATAWGGELLLGDEESAN